MARAKTFLAVLASYSTVSANSRILLSNTDLICADTEEVAVFDIFLDQKAQDTGWQLTCDGKLLWNTPVNTLTSADASTWKSESSCIATNTTCYFDIFDASGDGISNEGFYALTYGAVTVAVYEYGTTNPFLKDTFCFGPNCETLPLELAEENNNKNANNDISNKGVNNTDNTQKSQNNQAAKIGGIVGGIVGILIILAAIAAVVKCRKNKVARGEASSKVEDSESTLSGNDHEKDNSSGINQNNIRIVKTGTDDGDSVDSV
jgi:hypothetical protein